MLGSSRRSDEFMRVTVVVLGDLGRSPRMQYHAEALAAHQVDVDVIARAGSVPIAGLRDHPRITCHLLPPSREASWPALRPDKTAPGPAWRRAATARISQSSRPGIVR